jgi:asparagine N-glycosylation enzyme membrane subunit Stt3
MRVKRVLFRYIITDIEMDTGKFYAMTTWYNSTLTSTPYQKYVIIDNGMNGYSTALLNTQDYYMTMISRLHNFDGSYTEPKEVYYVEYMDPETAKMSGPLVINAIVMNYTEARINVDNYNANAQYGYHAIAANPMIVSPVEPVPALRHYRLVHESPTNAFANAGMDGVDIKYVKTFEYVKGARIKGNGMIEVSVVSNTGRNFTYRQQSINGEFIVPYSTTGTPYDVKTKGKYKIIGTGKEYDVSENDVMTGMVIS